MASVVALIAVRWWIGALCLIVIVFGSYRVAHGKQISVRLVAESVGVAILCTLAINGAVAAWPFDSYRGDFIVVGAFEQQAQVAPFEESVAVPNAMYQEGETVTVVCRERGWKRPSKWWYRLQDRNGFMPADSLDPSPVTSPGTPPQC